MSAGLSSEKENRISYGSQEGEMKERTRPAREYQDERIVRMEEDEMDDEKHR